MKNQFRGLLPRGGGGTPGIRLGALLGGLCSPLSVTRWAEGGTRQRAAAASRQDIGAALPRVLTSRGELALLQRVALPRSKAPFLPHQHCLPASCLFLFPPLSLFSLLLTVRFLSLSQCCSVENETNQDESLALLELGPLERQLGKQVGDGAHGKSGTSSDSHRLF